MDQFAFDIKQRSCEDIDSRVTPSGNIDLFDTFPGDGSFASTKSMNQIMTAFALGRSNGILQLGAAELTTQLSPSLSYWRDFGKLFIGHVCGAIDPTDPSIPVIPEPDADEISEMVQSAPPMQGAEFINSDLLFEIWSELGDAIALASKEFEDGIEGYLKKHSSVWNVVGRVCFHLAENKRDSEYPFAFMATYVHKVSNQAKPQHLPLHNALKEYGGAGNRQKLLALLAPISRAAEKSAFISELYEAQEVFHPLKWTPREAHTFLQETKLYEQSGLVIRLPDWWSAKNKPQPKVTVSLGEDRPSFMGVGALLNFDVSVTLNGVKLTQRELKELLSASEGLVLLKGKWVEVSPEALSDVLSQWQDLQNEVGQGGISLGEALRLLSGADLDQKSDEISERKAEWSEIVAGNWLKEALDNLNSTELKTDIEENAGLNAKLRHYQKYGIQWLSTLRKLQLGGCLADDMGLGKTIQVLGVLNLSRKNKEKGTDLLVVPASLLENWRNEALKFAPDLKILIAHPSRTPTDQLKSMSKKNIDAYDAVVTTYGTATRLPWLKEFEWRNVILDEAQAIKNPTAKQTKSVKELKSNWRLTLTGTPIENRLTDLWSIFDFLNPGLLGPAKKFNDYCKSIEDNPHRFAPLRKLVQPYVLRRLKTDKNVISDLPDKTEVRVNCSLSKKQAALYKESVEELKKLLESLTGMERRGVVLSFLMRFKQICNHPSQWLGDNAYDPDESGKFSQLRDLCETISSRQDKVLVFSQFREMSEPLAGFLSGVFGRSGHILHGGTPVKKRQELVKSFQEDERIPFMVLSLKAGGTGLNLTSASHVIHFDRWWNPAVENQATDRAFRIGQKKNVLVHKFVCQGTLEENIDNLIASKRKLSEEVLSKDSEISFTEMSNDEILSMVSLDLESAIVK